MKSKTFDAVSTMRTARQKLAEKWENKPRKEEIDSLRRKHGNLTSNKKTVGQDR